MAGRAMGQASQAVPDAAMRRGAKLILAGLSCWIVNGVILLFAFLVAALSAGDTFANPRLTIARALQNPSIPAIPAVPAVIALVVAGALIGGGLLILRKGTIARDWPETGAREVYGVSPTTRWRARVAAILVLVYVGVGGIAFMGFSFSTSGTATGGESTVWLVGWLFASVALTAGAIMFSQFARGLYADSSYLVLVRGTLFTDYAIANLIGLTFFVISNLASSDVARVMDVLGVFTQMLIVPLTSIIAFSALLLDFLAARKTRTLARPVREVVPATGALPIPSPTTAVVPGPRTLDEGWVSGLQARMDGLEKAVREQNDSLAQLRGLVSPRGENVPPVPAGTISGEPSTDPGTGREETRPRLQRKDEPPAGGGT
ncbi:MAG TPA: hypothetical protein VIL58_08540 [Thermoplasmata archaeon]